MLNLAKRSLLIFFRQKSAVFFSLLGVLVIIGLYVVFLGNVWLNDYQFPNAENLMNHWIIAGIVSVASITTTMGAFGIMVEDRMRKNTKDFFASPIKRSTIVGGYILCAYLVGIIMSFFTFLLGELYILSQGGDLLPFLATLKVLGVILLTVLMSSTMVFFLVSFFFSQNAFTTASTILGTLVGFVTGIYLPIGTLPDTVQWVIKLFPLSHSAALMRQIMMEIPMKQSFQDAPMEALDAFKEAVGITFSYQSYTAAPWVHLLILASTTVVFFLLAVLHVSHQKKI